MEHVVEILKICTKCKKEKPIFLFGISKKYKNGICSWCKDCRSQYEKQRKIQKKIILIPREGYKFCTKCGEEKLFDEFYIRKNNKSGLSCRCKDCAIEKKQKYQSTYQKQYKENNSEYINDKQKKYNKTRKGKETMSRNYFRRKSKLEKAICFFSAEEWEEIKKSQNYCCAYCGKPEPEIKLTRDHIIPVTLEGNHTASNIQGLCKKCNSIKNNKIDIKCARKMLVDVLFLLIAKFSS
jgi:5-methylcytosine-specific restriction endonuclease McrA